MNKSESKYFNTAVKMDEALLSILEKKDFEYITVKEICEAAGVNRSTFYLHYENTSELLEETTRYIVDKHFAYYGVDMELAARRVEEMIERGEREGLIFMTGEYLAPYLTFIKDNRRVFRLSVRRYSTMNMGRVYDAMFRGVFEPILAHFRVPERERAYVIKFYLTGVFAIIMEWLNGDCRDSIEDMIKVINDCVMREENFNAPRKNELEK